MSSQGQSVHERLHAGTDETIESVADLERAAEAGLSPHQRLIERITSAVGRPRAIAIVITFVVCWIALNIALGSRGRAFDPPPFSYLVGIISFAALLMTIFILTTENRTNRHDLLRDRLDLQINLLTERKISKVIEMLAAMRQDSSTIPDRSDPEAHELGRAANPHAIVRAIDERAST